MKHAVSAATLIGRGDLSHSIWAGPACTANFVLVRNSETHGGVARGLKALASPTRLQVLQWLKDPVSHFPPQVDGDLVVDGVCSDHIRDKLGMAASTTSRHLSLLADAGFVAVTRKKGWTFHRRNEAAIAAFAEELRRLL